MDSFFIWCNYTLKYLQTNLIQEKPPYMKTYFFVNNYIRSQLSNFKENDVLIMNRQNNVYELFSSIVCNLFTDAFLIYFHYVLLREFLTQSVSTQYTEALNSSHKSFMNFKNRFLKDYIISRLKCAVACRVISRKKSQNCCFLISACPLKTSMRKLKSWTFIVRNFCDLIWLYFVQEQICKVYNASDDDSRRSFVLRSQSAQG